MSSIIEAILNTIGGENRGQLTQADEIKVPHTIAPSHPPQFASREMHPLTQPFKPRATIAPPVVSTSYADEFDPNDRPVLMSPVRNPSSKSTRSHSPPHDSSVETGNISSLSNIDLSFGPQSLPFVFLRRKDRAPTQTTPSKPPISFSRDSTKVPILTNPRVPTNTPNVTTHALESGEIYESDSEPEFEVVTPKEVEMSRWREEQLRFMKPPRLAKDTVLRAIPTLHGPNNLPYARNPSGADAVILDDSYLSHVFSGRQVTQDPQPFSFDQIRPNTVYVNSQLRQRQLPYEKHVTPQEDLLVLAPDTHGQPKTSHSVSHTPLHGSPLSLASSVNSTKSAPPVSASAILRAQLGAPMHKLDPIPGSPTVSAGNPIDDLFRAMTLQAQGPQPADASSQYGGSQKENIPPPKAQATRAVPQGPIEGVNFGTTARIPSNETTQSSQSGTGTHSSSRTTISVPMAPALPSKADKSINWRDREREQETVLPSLVVTSPSKSNIPLQVVGSPVKEEVMTIDSLFEKFSNKIVVDHNPTITFNPPTPLKSTKDSAHLPLPPIPAVATPPPRAPLGEAAGQNYDLTRSTKSRTSPKGKKSPAKKDRFAAIKAAAPTVKGTPNAGKLLKKKTVPLEQGDKDKEEGSQEGVEKKSERGSSKAKGKGKAKAAPAKADEQMSSA